MKSLKSNNNDHFSGLNNLEDFIVESDHPCVMAQTVFKTKAVSHFKFDNIENPSNDHIILHRLKRYIDAYDFNSKKFQTFIIEFTDDYCKTEIEFETDLWNFLGRLKKHDKHKWDPAVSADVTDANFSYSILGKAFYIIGMHPNSSRNARKTKNVTLVFNLHHQFEILRNMGVYGNVRDRIRKRDLEKNGSINPMLADFGNSSEALQYSGRHVTEKWKCPFKH
ncbi:guanitoxin biosynthesis heme-dependent pre-guanitoxin N-hydroxylase GntA [Leeuwenhoekiella sp. W20_SRS_FM14]|uniref:guanitoxin biosynthesis heme-dependent pre-guanitoxin N-hydroxylase GntA n=1 Tax=Leeuwenhoekiella sp. W20_SRS_FM14 TaxID=3240270 RepID=UPI003F9AC204